MGWFGTIGALVHRVAHNVFNDTGVITMTTGGQRDANGILKRAKSDEEVQGEHYGYLETEQIYELLSTDEETGPWSVDDFPRDGNSFGELEVAGSHYTIVGVVQDQSFVELYLSGRDGPAS